MFSHFIFCSKIAEITLANGIWNMDAEWCQRMFEMNSEYVWGKRGSE